jgi:ABC-2 type transport system ATP-binding protein
MKIKGQMIQFESITKRFGATTAVDNFSMAVADGAYTALLGPNGAGKTTLVRMLLGFSAPTRGKIRIAGHAAGTAAARKGIGYLAENHKIPGGLSGKSYLSRHAALLGMDTATARKEIGRVLETVGMVGKENSRAATYSKGMNQRIGLAAALLGRPRVLILDEPVSGLDPIGIREFRTIIEELRGFGTTVLLNSHLLSEVEKTCDRVAVMHQGRLLAQGRIESIVAEGESLEDVFVRLIERQHGQPGKDPSVYGAGSAAA